MVVSPCCLERGLSSTPLHHQCEGRPPAFQASRATRATNSAVASAACLKGPRGARYSICGRIARPAFPAPSDGRERDGTSKTRAKTCAEIAKPCLYAAGCLKFESVRPSLRGAQATKQSIPRHSRMVRQHHTSDAQLRVGESRDSGLDASHRPGMTASGLLRGACHRARRRDPVTYDDGQAE